MTGMWPYVLLAALPGFIVAVIAAPQLARWARKRGHVDQADATLAHKQQVQPIPNIGGVAIALGLVVTACLAGLALLVVPVAIVPDSMTRLMAGVRSSDAPWQLLVILAVLAGIHIVGLWDDRKPLGPKLKLVIQLAGAVICALAGVRIFELADAWGPLGYLLSLSLTALWVVTITNAINFLDNMDGLAAGIVCIIAAALLTLNLIVGQWLIAAGCAALLGSTLGFLVWNYPPARIYMGDGGSLLLGFALALLAVETTYYLVPGTDEALTSAALPERIAGHWHAMLTPLVLLALPLYDITSVTLLRLAQGKSPFEGDKQHFSHRIAARGWSTRATVALVWLATAATAGAGIVIGWAMPMVAVGLALCVVAVLGGLAYFDFCGRSAVTAGE